MSSTVQTASGWEIQSSHESASEMMEALKTPDAKKEARVIQDRGKAPEEDKRDPAAVELGKKGAAAAAKAREERAKEAGKEPEGQKTAQTTEEAAPEEKKAEESPASEEKPEQTPAKPRHDLQARVQQLTSERRALIARLEALEAREAQREQTRAPEPPKPREEPQRANSGSDEPNIDQFEDYEQYRAAHERWAIKEALAEERKQREAERFASERQANAEKRHTSFREKVAERAAEWENVDHRLLSMMRDAPPILELDSQAEVGPANYITEAITQSDDPTGFALYLTENEDVVRGLLQSTPWELPMRLGKIEARFAREAREERREAAPRTSSAPPPIKPLSTSAQPDDDVTKEMSLDDFRRKKYRKA